MLKKLFLRTLGRIIPSDFFSHRFPVSVKGVCIIDNRVVLVQNERKTWDLPGGKLRRGETLEVALQREIREELNIEVQVRSLLQATRLTIMNRIDVLVVVYHCDTLAGLDELRLSSENFALASFPPTQLDTLHLPKSYITAIRIAFQQDSNGFIE